MWSELKGFKFTTTLTLVFKKTNGENKTKYYNLAEIISKAEIIINESDIDDVFNQSILQV